MKILPEVIYYCVPDKPERIKLYRYTRQTFIDSFFAKGHLRLNSLKVYRADAYASSSCINPEIQDNDEGKVILTQSKNGNAKVYTDFSQGVLNLSTSLTLSENILKSFQHGEGDEEQYGVFEISEPVSFARIIAQKIHTLYPLKQVMIGKCNYVEERRKVIDVDTLGTINNTVANNTSEQMNQNIPIYTLDMEEIIDVFFLKDKQHAHQTEFRFLWKGDTLVGKTHLDIEVPEAVQYCKRIAL
jgi:hypothetical protein